MKQLVTIVFALFFSFAGYGQDPVLFETDWYLHELNVEDETIYPPENMTIPLYFSEEPLVIGNSDFNGMFFIICNEFSCDTNFTDDTHFILEVYDQTLVECDIDENNQFELTYKIYFLQNEETYTTEIVYLGDSATLYIYDDEGNYALYGDEELSTQASNLSSIFIYPNPVTDQLHIQNFEQGFTGAAIYNLSGSKINTQIENNTVDVSNLSQGIYFLSLTTVSGKQTVHKFVKK